MEGKKKEIEIKQGTEENLSENTNDNVFNEKESTSRCKDLKTELRTKMSSGKLK